jgi:O-acetyl-ADP-ribose deacetylase (regulator of RNase III)
LIFPTKNQWRFPSDFEGIEEGLKYLLENYKDWGIESLALPALGCGLGRLSWEKVGPMMIKYLKEMDIPVEIYLPREARILENQKTKEFLLKS